MFALSLGGAYVITRMTTPVYRASTTLYFADQQGSIAALDLLSRTEKGNNEVATEMEVMRSRVLAGVVVDSLGLQARIIEPSGTITSRFLHVVRSDPLAPDSIFNFRMRKTGVFEVKNAESGSRVGTVSPGAVFSFGGVSTVVLPSTASLRSFAVRVQPRAATVDALLAQLRVMRPNPTASVVQISYSGRDRVETKTVPDVLAGTYLAWRANLRRSGDRSTVEFLRKQIDTISIQLYSAEEALRRYREANQVVDLPTQAQTQVQRQAALEAQRNDINMQRASLKSLMADVKNGPTDPRLGSPYRRLMAFSGLMTTGNPAFSLLQTLTDLEQRRMDLLVRRTPNDPDVQSITQAISTIENQIAAVVDTYVKGLDEQASSLTRSLAQYQVQVDEVPRREVEYARLERTATGLTQIYTMLQTRLREAQIAEAVDDGAVRVVDPAALPTVPIVPRPFLNLLLGALLGVLLSFAAVTLRERLDHTVHTKEEVEAITGAAVLALIPRIGQEDAAKYFQRWLHIRRNSVARSNGVAPAGDRGNRLLLKDAQSVASEAFRKLRTNITFARPDSPPRVLIFTSPAAGDGKSTSVMNLAIALVQQGQRVIVLDADMRRGGLHRMLNAYQNPGLSEILVGQVEFEGAVQSLMLESFGTVDMLATGIVPPNPAELLASPRFRALVESLRPRYDAVLIDSPPINLVTDAAIIGRETDGVVVVARAGKTTRGELAHAMDQLRQVQVPVTGTVLNDYNAKRDAGYNAPYVYGYSHDYRPHTA
jgi:capsular exopolysaccharide synthesis family protein